MERFLEREFCWRFEIEDPVEKVRELSDLERKLLSIYRYVLLRPRMMLLENPLIGLDREQQRVMVEYMREVAASGVTLIVSAKAVEELQMLCDRVWRA